MRTSNPIMKRLDEYSSVGIDSAQCMSTSGTLTNLFILGVIMLLPALVCWNWAALNYMDRVNTAMTVGIVGGLITGIVTCFNPKISPYTAPIYAAMEGLIIGGLSAIFEMQFPGIVVKAAASTIATVFVMIALFKTGLIKATETFRSTIVTATLSIACVYLIGFVLSLFGNNVISNFLWSSTPLSIGISVVICAIAALNLILDFDRIERFSQMPTPKFMEWYCAFGLLVTVVWLYLEILRLLAKTSRR